MDTSTPVQTVNFPIPLRPGVIAQVKIPHDLTKDEAERISRVVLALATTALKAGDGA